MENSESNARITVSLDRNLHPHLVSMSAQLEFSISQAIDEAIRAWLDRKTGRALRKLKTRPWRKTA